jgi:hypothetical protein
MRLLFPPILFAALPWTVLAGDSAFVGSAVCGECHQDALSPPRTPPATRIENRGKHCAKVSVPGAQFTTLAGDSSRYSPTMRRLGPPSTADAGSLAKRPGNRYAVRENTVDCVSAKAGVRR